MSLDLFTYRQTPYLLLRSILTLILVTVLIVTSGCKSIGKSAEYQEVGVGTALVSRDMLYALMQILPPDDTTIQYRKANSEFGTELGKGLKELGYGLQLMNADQGPMFLTYSQSLKSSNRNGNSTQFTLFVGDIGLTRLYTDVPGGGVVPKGAMKVYGSDTPIQLSTELFPNQSVEVEYIKNEPAVIEESAIVVVDQNVLDAISQLKNSAIPTYTALNFQSEEVENVALLGKSNFTELDTDYRVVRKDVVIFPNDSMLLLNKGREQIKKLVGLYREGSDVFRLIGCSHGPTSAEGGNQGLALGRSERIAKELISRKVSKADIRDEGCWAGEAISDWPGRGVVVELQRKNS